MSAQANLTAVDAIRLVKDAIRYTFVYEETPPDEVGRLKEYQRDVCAGITIPPEATEIPDYNHL